jgi:alanine racemase
VHLKIDTGMSRLGFPWAEAVDFARFVRQLPHLKIDSLYSHLATADSPDPTIMQQQQQRFRAALGHLQQQQLLPPRLHLANTAATLADPALHYDLVRVGLGLYGLYPAPHLQSRLDLQPVMQVKARITHLKDVPAGTGISYGHQYVCDRPLRLAVVGIGYADGVPRVLSNRLQVMVKGRLAQQIGAITMDQLMLMSAISPAYKRAMSSPCSAVTGTMPLAPTIGLPWPTPLAGKFSVALSTDCPALP